MPNAKHLRPLLWWLMLAVCLGRSAAQEPVLGPLYQDFKLTLSPGHRVEAVSPLYSHEYGEDDETIAFPPFFSINKNPATDHTVADVLYPIATYYRFGHEYRWQFIQVFSLAGGQTQEETDKKRTTIFPFYFQQRAANTNDNYTAFFPIYGTLKNRLFRDEIHFVCFPIYSETRKKDVVTDNYVYPFFHLRNGDGLHGWQVWPIMGREHKDLTTMTNGFGDETKVGGYEKLMVLWPFFFNNHLGIGTDNPQHEEILFPFYSFLRSPLRDSTTYFWPFGVTITDDREKKYHETGAPWPLIVFARGEGKTINRVWPFFGNAHNDSLRSDFYLWPLYKYNQLKAPAVERERTRILFYLFSNIREKETTTGNTRIRQDFWPFYTYKRDLKGNDRLQILAPVEPILPDNRGIERNWSPLWSLWRSENSPKNGRHSESLLWNLYRRDIAKDERKCSLLFGLFQYQSSSDSRELRLFHVPVIRHGTPPAPAGTKPEAGPAVPKQP